MATYGAMNAKWAPFDGAEPAATEQKMPTYGQVESLGPLNQSSDSLSFAEASAYGDNGRKIYLRKFQSGTVNVTSVDVGPETLGKVYGCEVGEEGTMAHGGADAAPYGGYGFLVNKIDKDGKEFYQGIFYPKVKGGPNESTTYDTKGENLTIALDSIRFAINEANCGKYKIESPLFETQAEADEWVAGLFDGTVDVPGLPEKPTCATPTADPPAGAVSSSTQVELKCETAGAEIHYTTDGQEPTASSEKYSDKITIDGEKTIKAIAIAKGYKDSAVLTAAYTISD